MSKTDNMLSRLKGRRYNKWITNHRVVMQPRQPAFSYKNYPKYLLHELFYDVLNWRHSPSRRWRKSRMRVDKFAHYDKVKRTVINIDGSEYLPF